MVIKMTKEELAEYGRRWREENPDKCRNAYIKRRKKINNPNDPYYEKNKDLISARSRLYYEKNREKVLKQSRERYLKTKYNLDSQQYFDLIKQQNNCCAICNKPEHRLLKTGDIKPLSVDHNHETGVVRALLCNDCNALLGFAKEDIGVLENAIKYIQSYH